MITINYNNWITDLLPPTRRQQKTIDWLNVYFNEIQTLYDWLMSYYRETLFEIQHNSQIMSLEHYLNSMGATGGTIYVSRDADYQSDIYNYIIQDHLPEVYETYIYKVSEGIFDSEKTYVYNESEGNPIFLWTTVEHENDLIDFDMAMKQSDYDNYDLRIDVMDKIDQFRLAGMTYELNPY